MPRALLAVALILVAVGLCGCGVGLGHGAASCPPSGCQWADVVGTVRVCRGHSTGNCPPAQSLQVSMFETASQHPMLATAGYGFRARYCLAVQTSGRYLVVAKVGGRVAKRTVDAVLGRTAVVNFVVRLRPGEHEPRSGRPCPAPLWNAMNAMNAR